MEVPTPPSGSKNSTRPSAASTIGKIKIVQVEEVGEPASSAGANCSTIDEGVSWDHTALAMIKRKGTS